MRKTATCRQCGRRIWKDNIGHSIWAGIISRSTCCPSFGPRHVPIPDSIQERSEVKTGVLSEQAPVLG